MSYSKVSDGVGFCLSISCDFQVAMAKVMEQGPVLVLTFMVQQIMTLRDAVGNIVEGGEVSSLKTLFNLFLLASCVVRVESTVIRPT